MCLILFAVQQHPEYPLVLVANRDEFHARPTAPAHFWCEAPTLLAGQDLEQGGTWLGVTRQGRFAAVTNIRDFRQPAPKEPALSRGLLTRNFLMGDQSPLDYLHALRAQRDRFPGFNLLLGEGHELYHYANREDRIRRLEPGIYGLCNALLDTPWPKVEHRKQALRGAISESELSVDRLLALMRDERCAEDRHLPDTGIGLDWERRLSACFIRGEDYGTRSTSVLLRHAEGCTTFAEQTHRPTASERPQMFHWATERDPLNAI